MSAGTIRRTVASLVVATAAAVTVSGAAFATKNTGGYKRSSEGIKQQYVDPCPGIYKQFEKDVNSAQAAHDAGNTQSMGDFLTLAKEDLAAGQKAGCDWAAEAPAPQFSRPAPTAPTSSRIY